MAEFFAILILITIAFAVVAVPFSRKRRDTDQRAEVADLEARKEAKYREIRDAELDFRTGKLSSSDYEELNQTLRAEAVELLRQLDALDDRRAQSSSDASIE